MFASRRVREALEKSIAKGLLVEEIVNVEGEVEFIIQLNVASEFVGELAYVTEGSHFQARGLDVQLAEVLSRNVVKVHEPAGKGPVTEGAEVLEGDAAAEEELQVRVNGMDAEVRDYEGCIRAFRMDTYLLDFLRRPTTRPTTRAMMHAMIMKVIRHILFHPPLRAT